MRTILYKAIPWRKEDALLALESGVDGLICPDNEKAAAAGLARCIVLAGSEVAFITLAAKADEERAAALALAAARREQIAGNGAGDEAGESDSQKTASDATAAHRDTDAPRLVVLRRGWEIIPLENLLAGSPGVAVETGSLEEAVLAAGVLEHGAETMVITPEAAAKARDIVAALRYRAPRLDLAVAEITSVTPAGMGHRVCVDTSSLLESGQGMLVGNSAAFTFLVNAETEQNEYVAARPFRVNAGGVHAYTLMPHDRTSYLGELAAGHEVLIVGHDGSTSLATVGRVKVERRPMLLIEARLRPASGQKTALKQGDTVAPPATVDAEQGAAPGAVSGTVFLQNAETIRLVRPDGKPVSVVELKPGDAVLCRVDVAGRHFGMRITENIQEG